MRGNLNERTKMANFTFDATTVEPSAPSGPIPAGTYLAHVIESDLKALKSGNGTGLALTFQIIDGEFKNRRVWSNLNVQHTNPKAQEIGQQQLSTLCRCLNVPKLTATEQLHNKPVKVRIKIRTDAQFGDKNEIAGFDPASGVPAQAQVVAAAPAAQAKAPWM
jgi:hypothetical protein